MTPSLKIKANYSVLKFVSLMSQILTIKIQNCKKKSRSQFPHTFILVQPDDGLLGRNMLLN